MEHTPILKTNRLILRSFLLDDAPMVQTLAGDRDVAGRTLNIPYPYENGMAEEWISKQADLFAKREQKIFAIVHRDENYLVGAIELSKISQEHETAEIGYWIGKHY